MPLTFTRRGLPPTPKACLISIFFALLLFHGCAAKQPVPSPEIARILASLEPDESVVNGFRGVGKLRMLRHAARNNTVRVVWIGTSPNKLRVEILGPWGQPTATFASDGAAFVVYSHHDKRYFKGDASATNISRLLSIPVSAEDLVRLLSGHAPVEAFHSAGIMPSIVSGGASGGWLLSLHGKWGRMRERVWLSSDMKRAERVEVFDASGDLRYKIDFSEFRQAGALYLPHKIEISDADGPVWLLAAERFWTDISVPDDAYTVGVPGDSRAMDLEQTN